MTINYQIGDLDADGTATRARAAALERKHRAIVNDAPAAGDFWVHIRAGRRDGQKVSAGGSSWAQHISRQ